MRGGGGFILYSFPLQILMRVFAILCFCVDKAVKDACYRLTSFPSCKYYMAINILLYRQLHFLRNVSCAQPLRMT